MPYIRVLECVADTTVGERRSIRFLLDKQLSGKAFNDISVFSEFDEAVMLFGCTVCLEVGTSGC